jgi:hypothetical protein
VGVEYPLRIQENGRMASRLMRRQFAAGLLAGVQVVWPVLSALLGVVAALGLVIGRLEGWSVPQSIYFAFVSGLTIGYGDFAPKTGGGRLLAVLIGICGVLFTALVAAIAVKALTATRDRSAGDS